MTWEEYADTVQAWRDVLRKTKTHLHLNLGREMKDNEASSNTSPATGRWENVGLLLKGDLVKKDREKAKVLNVFMTSVCLYNFFRKF